MKPSNTCRGGSAAIEFALVFPIVFSIFFAFIEHGRLMMIQDMIQNAAREGARYAAVAANDPSVNDADIIAWVNKWMVGQEATLSGYQVTVFKTDTTGANLGTWKSAQYLELIAVRIEGTHTVWLPVLTFLPPTIKLDARAIAVPESN